MIKIPVGHIPYVNNVYPELKEFQHIYVTELGNVIDRIKNKELIKRIDEQGYETVSIGGKNYYVHRLVAYAFVDKYNEEYNIVCHKNKNRIDNRAINLMWTNNNFINIRRSGFESPNKGRVVIAFKKDGSYCGTFDNGNIASEKLNLNRSEVYRCCKGLRKSTGGYTFSYLDNYIRI